ncbi:MAG: hypothetical protein WCO19_03365 [Candidatus Saccharibacteria bacterium]
MQLNQVARADTPAFSYVDQVGQPDATNTAPQGWQGVSGDGLINGQIIDPVGVGVTTVGVPNTGLGSKR